MNLPLNRRHGHGICAHVGFSEVVGAFVLSRTGLDSFPPPCLLCCRPRIWISGSLALLFPPWPRSGPSRSLCPPPAVVLPCFLNQPLCFSLFVSLFTGVPRSRTFLCVCVSLFFHSGCMHARAEVYD